MDGNGSNPSDASDHDLGSLNEELQNNDDILARDSANKYVFSVLRLTTTGVLNFEQKNGRPGDGRQARLTFKNRYRNTSPAYANTFAAFR